MLLRRRLPAALHRPRPHVGQRQPQLVHHRAKAANTFNVSADNLAPFFKQGDLLRLIQLDGIPAWASPDAHEDAQLRALRRWTTTAHT